MSGIELPGQAGEAADGGEPTANTMDVDDAGSDGILSRLLSTHEPDTTPRAIQTDYEVPKGVAFMLYGTLQMAETGGIPAIGNVLLGLYLQAQEAQSETTEEDTEEPEVRV